MRDPIRWLVLFTAIWGSVAPAKIMAAPIVNGAAAVLLEEKDAAKPEI